MVTKTRPSAAESKSLYNFPVKVYTVIPTTIRRSTVMAKHKTVEQARAATAADGEIVTLTAAPPKANPAVHADAASAERQPGDDTQKSWVKKASVIVDPEAGVKFSFDYEKHQAIITFDQKPTPEVLAVARPNLNEGGFEWDKVNKDGWKKKIQFLQREDERREAKKTFYAVANAIREQKGLPARSFGEAIAF
jgi:hypothetical protein